MEITYALLSIGVNRVPNATTLRFAERNALRFELGVASANGEVSAREHHCAGAREGAEQLARLRPTYFALRAFG